MRRGKNYTKGKGIGASDPRTLVWAPSRVSEMQVLHSYEMSEDKIPTLLFMSTTAHQKTR